MSPDHQNVDFLGNNAFMETLFKEKKVGLSEAVSVLGVCAATVRNWVKHQYLNPQTIDGKLAFDLQQLTQLKTRISAGEINRLNRRANKRESTFTFVPIEYAESPEVLVAVESIVENFRGYKLELKASLLSVILGTLEQRGLVARAESRDFFSIEVQNPFLKQELSWWFEHADTISLPAYASLVKIQTPNVRDFLGLVYQSLAKEGVKAKGGSYYTPGGVADEVVAQYVTENSIILDPCCGTGQFLLAAAEKVAHPSHIWGFDNDEIAVRLARMNMLMRFPEPKFQPHLYCKNTLLAFPFHARIEGKDLPKFDVIFTNPPWGVHFSAQEIAQFQVLFPPIKSNEAFSLFLAKGLQLLKEGGLISYILPESFLNIKVHADVRELVLNHTTIRRVVHLGRIFQNVFTPAIRLDLTKGKPPVDSHFTAVKKRQCCDVMQSRLATNDDQVFDLFTEQEDLAIFEKVYGFKYMTLEGNADWALGVVTGDNKRHLSDHHQRDYEPILTGKDLRRFSAGPASKFIHFTPEKYQQVAPTIRYRAPEKLLYRFISSELIFSYDNQQTLSLNSANVLIPRTEEYPVKSILGILNSSLYQLIFQKKIGAFKILRGDIEKLPLPIITSYRHQCLIAFVNTLLDTASSNDHKRQAFRRLDDFIMDLFDLSVTQKGYVLSNAKVSSKLLPFD